MRWKDLTQRNDMNYNQKNQIKAGLIAQMCILYVFLFSPNHALERPISSDSNLWDFTATTYVAVNVTLQKHLSYHQLLTLNPTESTSTANHTHSSYMACYSPATTTNFYHAMENEQRGRALWRALEETRLLWSFSFNTLVRASVEAWQQKVPSITATGYSSMWLHHVKCTSQKAMQCYSIHFHRNSMAHYYFFPCLSAAALH